MGHVRSSCLGRTHPNGAFFRRNGSEGTPNHLERGKLLGDLTIVGGKMIRRIAEKGPRVVAYRGWQLGRLLLLRTVRYWTKLPKHVYRYWDISRIEQWLAIARNNELLIGPEKLGALRYWSADHSDWVGAAEERATSILKGRLSIFEQVYEFDLKHDGFPWHTDWRWGYTWEPAYYKTYRFYLRDKGVPYDVKFPWELSRLSFLLPLAQMAVITHEPHWREQIASIVANWEEKNPVAYSVNWYSMESAVRGINLVLVTQMLAADSDTLPEHLAPLLRQLTLHGEFLYRNIEFTDVRGNHYMANLVALLLLGYTLQRAYRPAVRWTIYAARRICPEIELQYCSDGVYFQKSTGYHRLVSELSLLSLIALEQAGHFVSEIARERIYKACEYTRFYTRPDGLAPNWGDNDSACVLGFDLKALRDHRSLLALAAAYFSDATLKLAAQQPSAAIPWLLGTQGVQQWDNLEPRDDDVSVARWFKAGGMVVSRTDKHYLFANFGDVGHNGRGSHAHNDTFSFVLSLCQKPLIVDAGSPVYTGDLATYSRYRSTSYHNTVRIDGQEMARLLGKPRILNEAAPANVRFQAGPEYDFVQGEHRGYTRLTDPVLHRRALTFYKHEGRLICQDTFHCVGSHHVEQFLHFAPGIQVVLQEDSLQAQLAKHRIAFVRWSSGIRARVERAQVSENYGHMADSWRLVLESQISGDTKLSFEIVLGRLSDT